MFDELDDQQLSDEQRFGLFQELSRNTSEDIRRQRTHFRVSIKAGVSVQPGNSSELCKFSTQGVRGDISEGGLGLVLPAPDVPLTFARCVRCRLIKEDAYECGFQFFTSIVLPETVVVMHDAR